MRNAAAHESSLDRGCRGGDGDGGAREVDTADAAVPQPLRFENMLLWATGETGTTESVQAKFGGAQAVRHYARRRSGRSACLPNDLVEKVISAPINSGEREGAGGGHLRAKRHSRGSGAQDRTAEQATPVCLEDHLKEHPQDVRAAFALEMVLQTTAGIGVDRQVSRLRDRVLAESGEAGVLLWNEIHARAAVAAAAATMGVAC